MIAQTCADLCRPVQSAIIAITSLANQMVVIVANLVVRNLEQQIVDALKQRAARYGRSAEAEHRIILEESLLRPKGRSFAEALAAMPNVGKDEDFLRIEDEPGNHDVFN